MAKKYNKPAMERVRKLKGIDHCENCWNRSKNGQRLDMHHIDNDVTNNDPSNLLQLCPRCHKWLEWREEYGDRRIYFEEKYKIADPNLYIIEYLYNQGRCINEIAVHVDMSPTWVLKVLRRGSGDTRFSGIFNEDTHLLYGDHSPNDPECHCKKYKSGWGRQ